MPLLPAASQAAGSPGGRWRPVLIAAVVAAVTLGALAFWAAAHPGSYGRSHAGCITVTVPSSMGGALLHQCGAAARATCRHARQHADRLSLLIRPQCTLAGLG